MRKLTWAAIGFAAAALLAEYALPVSELPLAAAALAVCGFLFVPVRRKKLRARAMICLLAAVAGLLAWNIHYVRHVKPSEELVGERVTVFAEVTDYPCQKDGYYRLDVKVLEGAPRERAALYRYGGEMPELEPGDVITVEIRVALAIGDGEERSHYFTAGGQYLRGYMQADPAQSGRTEHPWRYFPQKLARGAQRLCGEVFSEDTAPFMMALLTGETDELQENRAQYAQMRAAGVLHIVAVSGMHLLVLIQMVELLLGRSRRTSLLCFPVMLVFVLMAGCRASVVRAAVMQSVLLMAPLVEREHDGITGVSAAVLALLIHNPMAIGGVGFQLSFACVLGLAILLPPLRGWMGKRFPMGNRFVRAVGNSLATSLAAVAFSMPIAAYYFGTIPLLSGLANLLTLSVVEVCFGAGYILCGIGLFLPGVAALGGWVLDWAARWCLWVFEIIGRLPFACLYTDEMLAVLWLAGVYALWIGWYILRRRGRRISSMIPLGLCAIGLGIVVLWSSAGFRRGFSEISVLDVGQGQCVLLADPQAAIIVDCGGSDLDNAGDTAANHLLASGKSRVDLLILTHLHDDHTNGVETLLGRIPVELILLPASADDEDDVLENILTAAENVGTDVIRLSEPCEAELGSMRLDLYLPQAGTEENERGIVVSAEVGGETVLIMGDGGTETEFALFSTGQLRDTDILVVGHHGSKSASGALFLRAVQPETAIISVGDNSYGLPAEETLETLHEYGSTVRRTDEEGTITIQNKTDGRLYG